jgi:hypothetical protein
VSTTTCRRLDRGNWVGNRGCDGKEHWSRRTEKQMRGISTYQRAWAMEMRSALCGVVSRLCWKGAALSGRHSAVRTARIMVFHTIQYAYGFNCAYAIHFRRDPASRAPIYISMDFSTAGLETRKRCVGHCFFESRPTHPANKCMFEGR